MYDVSHTKWILFLSHMLSEIQVSETDVYGKIYCAMCLVTCSAKQQDMLYRCGIQHKQLQIGTSDLLPKELWLPPLLSAMSDNLKVQSTSSTTRCLESCHACRVPMYWYVYSVRRQSFNAKQLSRGKIPVCIIYTSTHADNMVKLGITIEVNVESSIWNTCLAPRKCKVLCGHNNSSFIF